MQTPQKDVSKRRRIVSAACICLMFWLYWNISSIYITPPGVVDLSKAALPSCKYAAEDHDTLFILRTGATEIADRIPAHISTSLRCFTQHVIFSDYAETFHGESVLDVLENSSTQRSWPTIVTSNYTDASNNTAEIYCPKAS
jgi:hypothetical protein